MSQPVKIIVTTGPAIDSASKVLEMATAGVDIFRLNFSHCTREEALMRVPWVRAAERKLKRPLGVLGDLAGPKIRIGNVSDGIVLNTGDRIRFVRKQVAGTKDEVCVATPEALDAIVKGASIYIDDGKLKLVAVAIDKDGVTAEVIVGGPLESRKSFSADGLRVSTFALSEKDKKAIKTIQDIKADWVAVSFVQTAADITLVRNALGKSFKGGIIAKIETEGGVENAEEILKVADGIMVARGDLGLGMPMAEVPHVQKLLIQLANQYKKPVITATQMLDSMIYRHSPTRAEASDVANAILDGTDMLMLSGETSVGQFARESVEALASIIATTDTRVIPRVYDECSGIGDAVSEAVIAAAKRVDAKLIIAFTTSGMTARVIARHRPQMPIIAVTHNKAIIHRLIPVWNTYGVYGALPKNLAQMIKIAHGVAANNPGAKLKKGDAYIISAGVPFGKMGSTNLLIVERM